jgi:hypothetical protein
MNSSSSSSNQNLPTDTTLTITEDDADSHEICFQKAADFEKFLVASQVDISNIRKISIPLLRTAHNDEYSWVTEKNELFQRGAKLALKGYVARAQFMINMVNCASARALILTNTYSISDITIKNLSQYLWHEIEYPLMCQRNDNDKNGLKMQIEKYGNKLSQFHGQRWCRYTASAICKGVRFIMYKLVV